MEKKPPKRETLGRITHEISKTTRMFWQYDIVFSSKRKRSSSTRFTPQKIWENCFINYSMNCGSKSQTIEPTVYLNETLFAELLFQNETAS
jgi:hypothetical protein